MVTGLDQCDFDLLSSLVDELMFLQNQSYSQIRNVMIRVKV